MTALCRNGSQASQKISNEKLKRNKRRMYRIIHNFTKKNDKIVSEKGRSILCVYYYYAGEMHSNFPTIKMTFSIWDTFLMMWNEPVMMMLILCINVS